MDNYRKDHQSLALLAGVAVDKGPETKDLWSRSTNQIPPAIDHVHNVPIEIEVGSGEDYLINSETDNHREVLEVRYILDPEITNMTAAEEETISSLVVDDEEIMNIQISDIIDSNTEEQNVDPLENNVKGEAEQIFTATNCNPKQCFVCFATNLTKLQHIFDDESKKILLPQLLSRHMGISIIPRYNDKNEYFVCEACVQMLTRCNEVWRKYNEHKKKIGTRTGATSSPMDFSEDDNNQSQDDDTSNNNNNRKKRGKYQRNVGSRKYRYDLLKSSIKNLMLNSSHQYLIRREFTDEDWDYIVERLHTTKSNSSTKIKEIETMTFSNEKLLSVFCEDCRKSIPCGKDGYFKHRQDLHSDVEDLTIPCDMCGNFYPEKDSSGLSENYFPHWISHFYVEECNVCKEKFPNASLLKKHDVIHQERPGFRCTECHKVLTKKTTLEQHIKTHLPKEEKRKHGLTCHICGKTITAPTLKAHMFSAHSDERPWKCEVCGVKFKHKSDLNGHRNAVHLKIKKYTCNICGKSFGHHCGLRVHMKKHENKRDYSCQTCGKTFITQWHLKKHVVTHKEEKDIVCETCGKGFKKIEALQEHATIHTGQMPYECHICGRKVRVLSNLYKHFIVHKKNKTYYSKKDGLPDPLDAYIAEQQKKRQVNKIVEENTVSKPTVPDIPSQNQHQSSFLSIMDSVTEPVLTVKRSSKRITYPGVSSNLTTTDTPTNTIGTTMLPMSSGVPGPSQIYITAGTNETFSLRLENGIAVVQPSQILYKVVGGSALQTVQLPTAGTGTNLPT